MTLLLQGNEYCTRATELMGDQGEDVDELAHVKEFKKICETWVFTPVISVRRSRKVESRQSARPPSTAGAAAAI